MFKLSLEWLNELGDIAISEKEFIEGMYRQGFEIASVEEIGKDKIIEIEVKANRPDLLSHQGVLREVYGLKNIYPQKEILSSLRKEQFKPFGEMKVKIHVDTDKVKRYTAIELYNIDNTGATPLAIKSRLERLGVKSINPVVDISNYILLLCGQPIHIYDIDKIKGSVLKIKQENEDFSFTTLNAIESNFPEGTVTIEDEEKVLCVGGIIGGHDAEVDANTKNILIESANFDSVMIRIASKRSHVATAASYIFERGADSSQCFEAAMLCAEEIEKLCGGELSYVAYDYMAEVEKENQIAVRGDRINNILGTNLSNDEIIKLLKSTFLEAVEKGELLIVTIPSFRLDIKLDVDIAEEVARMYGYHNIEAKLPELNVPIISNHLKNNGDELRTILIGYGFMECLTYSFIPLNALAILNIEEASSYFGDVILQNPLSNQYALMRPTMAFSAIDTIIKNNAKSKSDLKIFEIGKTYFKDDKVDTGYCQKEVLAVACTGNRLSRGFGNSQDLRYSIYDMLDLLASIMSEFNTPYSLMRCSGEIGFLDKNVSAKIVVENKIVGCIGKVSTSALEKFENGKLVKSDLLFMELEYEGLIQSKKIIQYQRDYPSMRREYNLLCEKNIEFETLRVDIIKISEDILLVQANDVYQGKGIPEGLVSLLIGIEYNGKNRTLNSIEVEEIETKMLKHLKDKYNIVLR